MSAIEVTAAVVLIGDEILQGEVHDSNMYHMANQLHKKGINLQEVRVIADDKQQIITSINQLRASHDYVFTTGGIGPTHDDITTASIAAAFGLDIACNSAVVAQMRAHNPDVSDITLRMANLPVGCKLIANKISIAPGFILENVFVLAGVPEVMQAMLTEVLPTLKSGNILHCENIYVSVAESYVALIIEALEQEFKGLHIGSYPVKIEGKPCVRLALRSIDSSQLTLAINKLNKQLLNKGFYAQKNDFRKQQ